MVGAHEAYVREVAVAFGVVHAVADDEEVGNGETYVVGFDFFETAGGFVEQGGDAEGFGVMLEEDFAQIGEGEAGIENVFDDEDIFSFNGFVEILDELDGAGGALAFAVAGDGDEVKCGVGLDGAG